MKRFFLFLFILFSLTAFAQQPEQINDMALDLMDQEKYREALDLLDKLVAEYPTTTAFRYNRAVTLFNLGAHQKAIADYKVLLQDIPESEYAFQIGNAYEQIDSVSKALSFYSRAIEMDSDNYLYFFKRGTLYLKKGDLSKAIDDFTASLKINSEHHNSRHNRGIALYYMKRQKDACDDWCIAAQLGNPHSPEHLKKNCRGYRAECDPR